MRALLVVGVVLAGCGEDFGTGWLPPGAQRCESNAGCAPDVCARDGQCWGESEVRSVHVTWTVNGQPASAATCAANPDLVIQLDHKPAEPGTQLVFSPVPCMQGKFTVDVLPKAFRAVQLGRLDAFVGADFDDAGDAAIELQF